MLPASENPWKSVFIRASDVFEDERLQQVRYFHLEPDRRVPATGIR